jgi:DHA2 family multidrug resistance protein
MAKLRIDESSYKWWALGVTIIGGFMSILDTSIVNIAIPKMMAVFSVDTDQAEWILTAYMLTMGVIQPATGYLCDVYGTKRMYLLSLAIFTTGSLLCGMAWSNNSMIAFRVVQALGGGLIIPVTMSLVYHIFTPKERNMAMGIWGISAMVAPAVGPTLSGYLVQYWDWRLIFTINIPIGILGFILAALILKETSVTPDKKFDYSGFLTCSVGLFCLLLGLSEGTSEGWTSLYIISLFYLAAASLVLFVYIELHSEEPLLDLTLFTNWNFTFSIIVSFIGTIGLYGGIFLVPLFLENFRGNTAMQTGMLLFPSAATAGLMMPVAAKLADKLGAKPVVLTGLTILIGATVPFMHLSLDTSTGTIMLLMMIRGLGLGLFSMPVTVMGMNTVPLPKVSRASSLNNAIRQISGSMGIAILTTVLQNRQIFHFTRITESLSATSRPVADFLTSGTSLFMQNGSVQSTAYAQAVAVINGLAQQQSFIRAFDDSFLFMAGICILALIPSLLLKPSPPGQQTDAVIIE